MCGISGIYKLNGSMVNEEELRDMTDIISYRGPDGFGYWFTDNRSLGLGHRRLSIIDLTTAGHQPMSYMGLTITFNGEIYNYLEIKAQLIIKGYVFKTESDTEVLLAAYHDKGRNCLQDFDGMFSFAIWDEAKKELFCARDRFGEKPFYYYHSPEKFAFGSEIKQLFAASIQKEVNAEMLYHYCTEERLTHPYDPKQTFYKNILQLPHGHYMLVRENASIVIEKYWQINHEHVNYDISLDDAAQTFNELLSESIHKRLRSDVATGTSLSGGLDSTTIAGFICRSDENIILNTFTASFEGFEKDETKYVKILKDRYSNINDRYVSPKVEDLVNDLENLLYHQDEPIVSTSMYAQYRVMKLAKENRVTVLLDGQGSDEFMGGYNQYWPVRLREMFAKGDQNYLKEKELVKELIGFEQNIEGNLAFMLKYPGIHKKLAVLKSAFKKEKDLRINNPIAGLFTPVKSRSLLHDTNWSDLSSVLNNSMLHDGLQNLLRYADRNSMAHSREIRLPFLYHKLVEFVFTLPSHYKMSNGWSKLLLRKAQDKYLPADICWRKDKVGYATPQSYWMQHPAIIDRQAAQKKELKKLGLFDDSFLNLADGWKVSNLYQLIK